MATHSAHRMSQAGQEWLLACAPDPADVQRTWDAGALAEFPTGQHWRVAEAPLVPSVEAIARIAGDRVGPVLGDIHRHVAWWLLPPGLTDELDDIRRVIVRPAGWVLKCPPVLYSVGGLWWPEQPDGSGVLTDPVLLGAAFSPGGARLSTEASR